MLKIKYLIFIGISFIFFFATFFYMDKKARNESAKLSFSGAIQNVVIFNNTKGVNFKIEGKWYNFDYRKDFEDINYIDCKIIKKSNESGVWIQSKKGSDHFVFYQVSCGIIENKQYLNRLKNFEINQKIGVIDK